MWETTGTCRTCWIFSFTFSFPQQSSIFSNDWFLCNRRPTALQDRARDSDDDDYQDRDYDVAALANNLSQAFHYGLYKNDMEEVYCATNVTYLIFSFLSNRLELYLVLYLTLVELDEMVIDVWQNVLILSPLGEKKMNFLFLSSIPLPKIEVIKKAKTSNSAK